MFNADKIDSISFIGYSDEEREEFINGAEEFFDKEQGGAEE
jgi:hypothetical protein